MWVAGDREVAGDRKEATNLGLSSCPTPALALLLFCPLYWLHLKTTKTTQIPPLRTVWPREIRKCQVIGNSVREGAENPGVPANRLRLFHNQVLPGNHALSTSCWIWDGHTDSTPEHFPVSAAGAELLVSPAPNRAVVKILQQTHPQNCLFLLHQHIKSAVTGPGAEPQPWQAFEKEASPISHRGEYQRALITGETSGTSRFLSPSLTTSLSGGRGHNRCHLKNAAGSQPIPKEITGLFFF